MTVEETAQKLVDDLSWTRPAGNRMARVFRRLMGRLFSTQQQPKLVEVPATSKATDEIRLASAEGYLSLLCAKLDIKTPLLVFADDMVNVGACGEAGQSTIWLHRQSTLTRD